MKKKVYLIIAILLFIWFPVREGIKLNPRDFKSHEKEGISTNGPSNTPFIVGVMYGLNHLDPHFSYNYVSGSAIAQVCEGLFRYNLSHPSHEIIPHLASEDGTWSGDGLEFTILLQQGITFHDGYKFNASVIKWNFDRLAYLMNISGTLPNTVYYGMPSTLGYLYEWPDGTPIINRTEVLSEYVVRFVLNKPYGSFKALLCFSGSYMLSPFSTPAADYINPDTDDLIGTGPFVYDGHVPDINATFHAYENYWSGEANIDQMIFKVIANNDARHIALLSGDIHFLEEVDPAYINTFKADNNLTVLDSGKTQARTNYLGMNNKQINKTWREAISYAINYSSTIENLMGGQAIRLKSPVPEGVLYANGSFNVPVFDRVLARSYMNQMGYGIGFTTDGQWINVAQGSSPFATFNYTYNVGNLFREGMFSILEDNLAYIGVRVEDAGMQWEDFKDRLYNRRVLSAGWDALQLYAMIWQPYFNDPSIYVNNFYSNTSTVNRAQVNDPYLQNLMEQGLKENDPAIRKTIYDEIQRYLVEDLRPHAWLLASDVITAHHNNLTGFQQNSFNILDFYSCIWNPYKITINSPADINFVKGALGNNITWTLSAVDLLNPTYNITVNGILNRTDSWQSGVPIIVTLDHLSPGTYTYQISAKNENEMVQDTVIVIVDAHVLTITHPEDITFTEGSTGNAITWIITTNLELDPTYDLYINDTFSYSDSWESGVSIFIDLDALTKGSYEYRIEASNGVEMIKDTVIVNVNAKAEEDGFTILLITIGIASGAGLAVIITNLVMRKRRR
ncbi:MAG: ABC transporter substrate-binding protein [Candidatus Hermodarchaeota archaeon]